jgi:hypothetical protein
MSTLLKLEKDFLQRVLANSYDMDGDVVGTAAASAEERVSVYVEGYRLRLLEVLQDNYAGLHGMLGDEEFDRLGRAYIDAHPSTHPSVRWFGRHIADHIRETPLHEEHPYLAEMADFEWAQAMVFDAADEPTVDMQALAALSPEDWAELGFQLHAAVQRLDLAWNVPQVWQALDAKTDVPELASAETARPWLLWRADFTTNWRSLGADEAWALDAVRADKNFAELCEGLCQWHEESAVALHAASLLKRWLSDGLITRLLIR